jgi:hypothetical protein
MHCLQVALSASFESTESVAMSCCRKLPGNPSSEGREPSAAAAYLVRLARRILLARCSNLLQRFHYEMTDMSRSSDMQLVDDVPCQE